MYKTPTIGFIILFASFFTLIYGDLIAVPKPIIDVSLTTKKGPIIGLRNDPNPNSGVSFDAFMGIPYGQIPARFQLAEPRASWSEPLYTQESGPSCPQPNITFDEDCLRLNVFTPVNALNMPGALPVMVFIHGARFTDGDSNPNIYGPDFIVNESVVMVSMNYRLGAAGFLTLNSRVAPGNMGLQDTLLALQWVHDEIYTFGGDPSQVTLFGYSSGSIMTQMHYLSPLSTDLFVRVIAQSGSALADWGHYTPAEGARRAKVLAQAVHCDTTLDDSAILACLQAADLKDITANQFVDGIISEDDGMAGNSRVFLPVLDTYLIADRPFFNDTLENLMVKALNRRKPIITGFNTHEGIFKLVEYDFWKSVDEDDMDAFIPHRALQALDNETRVAVADDIKNRYFSESANVNKANLMVNLYTDAAYAYPSIQMTRFFANFTYGYLFAYMGTWVHTAWYIGGYRVTGVNHGDEIKYLLYESQDMSSTFSNLPNINMKNQLVKWWTTFSKTGVPGAGWKTVAEDGYLVIDSKLSTINCSAFESRYYNFWADI